MIPEKLYLENFVSHLKSEIDFSKFQTSLIIGAQSGNPGISNGVGKSSIFAAMRWVLFNKTHFSSKDKIVKNGKASCKIIFEFSVGDIKYKIIRQLNKKTGIGAVSFFKGVGGVWEKEGLTCDTPTLTNKKIIEIIGMSDETFVNSVYFKQDDIAGFAVATNSKRKEILKEVLQIEIWDKFEKQAKDKNDKMEEKFNSLNEQLKKLEDIEERYNNNEEEISKIKNEIISKTNELDRKQEELNGLLLNLDNSLSQDFIFSLKERVDSLIKRKDEIIKRKEDLQKEIKKNNERLVLADSDCGGLQKKLIVLSEIILKTNIKNRKRAFELFSKYAPVVSPMAEYDEDNLEKNKKELNEKKQSLSILKKDLSNINLLEPGNHCPTCLSIIKDVKEIMEKRDKRKKFIEGLISEKETEISLLDKQVSKEGKKIKEAIDASIEIERYELMLSKRVSERNSIDKRNEIIQQELKDLSFSFKEIKENYSHIKNQLDNSNVKLDDKIKDLRNEVQKINIEKIEKEVKLGNYCGRAEEMRRSLDEKQAIVESLDNLRKNLQAYKELVRIFGKNGIQSIIMENITEDLRNYTNIILQKICNGDSIFVDFITQKQMGSGNWKEQFDVSIRIHNSYMDFNDLSGGEKIRVAIAIRLALSQLLTNRMGSNVNFLLLDEIDMALDKNGVNLLCDTLKILSKDLKILIITHNELMKEQFDNIIVVQKGPNGSIIKQ
jgi:DNA repair exonuclease SbcCD ATPase subunit